MHQRPHAATSLDGDGGTWLAPGAIVSLLPREFSVLVRPTSEIPFLRCLLQRTVHAMRRGFLRWRKRDSLLPFWKRKTLLSPRTKSLPCICCQRMLTRSCLSRGGAFLQSRKPYLERIFAVTDLSMLIPAIPVSRNNEHIDLHVCLPALLPICHCSRPSSS